MHPAARLAGSLQSVPAGRIANRLALPAESKIPAGVITVAGEERVASCRRLVASQSVKKNSLFFFSGPPRAPPYWLRMNLDLPTPITLNLGSALSALSL